MKRPPPGLEVKRCPWVKASRRDDDGASNLRAPPKAKTLPFWCVSWSPKADSGEIAIFQNALKVSAVWYSSENGSHTDLVPEAAAQWALLLTDRATAGKLMDSRMVSLSLDSCQPLQGPKEVSAAATFSHLWLPSSRLSEDLLNQLCLLTVGQSQVSLRDHLGGNPFVALRLLPELNLRLAQRSPGLLCCTEMLVRQHGLVPVEVPPPPLPPLAPDGDEFGDDEDPDGGEAVPQ